MKNATYLEIMQMARQKYTRLTTDPNHEWGALSNNEKQIITLTNLLEEIEKLNQETQQQIEALDDNDISDDDDSQSSEGDDTTTSESETSESDNESEEEDEDDNWTDEHDNWKTVAPKPDEQTSKTVNGTTWNWCLHHSKWCIHTSDECRLGKQQQLSTQETTANQATTLCNYAALLAQIKHQYK